MAKLESLKSGYYVWQYVPSMAAAVIFLVLFLLTTFVHFWKIFRKRVRFTLPFAIGGLFEIIGYATRIDSHNNTGKLMPYCIQAVFILLGPALFAASVYMVLARIIRSVRAEMYSVVPLNWVTKTFVISDVITFLVQAGGSGMMVNSSLSKVGQGVVIAGLCLQAVSFCLFIVTAYVFQTRMRRAPTTESFDVAIPWKKHLYGLYTISGLVLVRSIFRIVEYAMGNEGYPLSNEWTLYVFDAVPMFAAMVIFAIWYPSDLKPFLDSASQSGGAIESKG
ncbi:RTA1 like protein [Penicillium cosmopolitanum]|uniref:RTA1 like protein n=1 Tax=Penicillium cosmopolitanum TaxID=1131564 RepID=A0A9W9V6K9_9EURO|nr:RTA1 like protein [Penicillium cosmopolitanum]KAJ5369579.1 RTA1 like protein [Penicillium cosmopolitanum]